MKTFKGFLYGIAIAIAVSAGAATVYNYFPPPGMTYSPTAGLTVGVPTGGAQGTGTVNAQGVFVNGTAVASSSAPGSNTQVVYNNSGAYGASSLLTFTPGSVLLNIGAATTPGTFSVGQLDAMVINGVTIPIPGFALNSNIQGVFENHSYVNGVASGGARYYGVRSEGTISSPAIVVNGDHLSTFYAAGYNGSSYSLGGDILFQVNGTPGASAMPTDLLFQLSPAASQVPATVLQLYHDGGAVFGAPTGGDQGVGTINMQGCFVNGVACSTGGASGGNPTGTVGLTAVNGVAGTYMRSDAAPPLSQAISPTWSATHIFSAAYAGLNTGPIKFVSTQPGFSFDNTSAAANAHWWDFVGTVTDLLFRSLDDAGTAHNLLDATRSGATISNVSFGNATDNPTYSFLGTGTATFNGKVVVAGGNVTVNAPSSGDSLTINSLVGGNVLHTSDGTATSEWLSNGASGIFFGTTSNHQLQLGTNGATRVTLSNTGNVVVNTPSSGRALSATALANNYAISGQGSSTTGQSYGILAQAGTNSTDGALVVFDTTGTTKFFEVFGDGGLVAGAPTGGDKGLGTINAQDVLRNGQPIHVAACYATQSGTTVTFNNIVGCSNITRSGTGVYTVSFAAGVFTTSRPACTFAGYSNPLIYEYVDPSSNTSIQVNSVNSAGTLTDGTGFIVNCSGN